MANSGAYIILKTMKFKETDLIVYALNPKGGKQHFLARGALKSKKRFGGGVLEPLNYVHLAFDNRKEKSEFIPLSEAKLLDGFEGLRRDYDRLQTGLNILKDTFYATVEGSDDNASIYNVLGNTLKKLESVQDPHLLRLHFRIKLLFYSGYLPNEEGIFNPFLEEPVHNCEKLKPFATARLRTISDQALRDLGI